MPTLASDDETQTQTLGLERKPKTQPRTPSEMLVETFETHQNATSKRKRKTKARTQRNAQRNAKSICEAQEIASLKTLVSKRKRVETQTRVSNRKRKRIKTRVSRH